MNEAMVGLLAYYQSLKVEKPLWSTHEMSDEMAMKGFVGDVFSAYVATLLLC